MMKLILFFLLIGGAAQGMQTHDAEIQKAKEDAATEIFHMADDLIWGRDDIVKFRKRLLESGIKNNSTRIVEKALIGLKKWSADLLNDTRNAFFSAVNSNKTDLVKIFLKKVPNIIAVKDDRGALAIHHAANKKYNEMAFILLDHGANINAVTDRNVKNPYEHCTPLYIAAYRDNDALVTALLERKADPNITGPCPYPHDNVDYYHLLGWVAIHKQKYIEPLIKADANPNGAGKDGLTPLLHAARTNNAKAIPLLLAHGANPDLIVSPCTMSPLMATAQKAHLEVAHALIEGIELPNAKKEFELLHSGKNNYFYLLPLEIGPCMNQYRRIAANVSLRNEKNQNALGFAAHAQEKETDAAKKEKRAELMKLLESQMPKESALNDWQIISKE